MVSGARGLLIILTREDPLADADEAALSFLRRDPSGDKDWPGFVFPSRDLPSDAGGTNFIPSRVDGPADKISIVTNRYDRPFIRLERLFQRFARRDVEMVGRLVKDKHVHP